MAVPTLVPSVLRFKPIVFTASFICGIGAAIESFAKLGDSIYFEEEAKTPAVYIAQFTSSDFEWDAAGLVLHQSHKPLNAEESVLEVSFSFSRGTKVGASAAASEENTAIHIRIPAWNPRKGCRAYLNDEEIEAPIPGMNHSCIMQVNGEFSLSKTTNIDVVLMNLNILPSALYRWSVSTFQPADACYLIS